MIKHLRVLVVDDDPIVVELLSAFLDTKGYAVQTSANGHQALEIIERQEFDLVVSDIEMAGVNGFELLRHTRVNYPRIGIVLMTGYEESHPLSVALRAGADGYLSKPFSLRKFSLIFEQAYWNALSRDDWWDEYDDGSGAEG
jgi:CheY-like chemotaxis protein